MYEICIDEQGDHVLAKARPPEDALAELDRIGDETAAQLRSNGEGHEQFVLRLLVYDMETGEVVAQSGVRG
jgi:hypothetical protein